MDCKFASRDALLAVVLVWREVTACSAILQMLRQLAL